MQALKVSGKLQNCHLQKSSTTKLPTKNKLQPNQPLPSHFFHIHQAMSRPWPLKPQPSFPPLPQSPGGLGSPAGSVGVREALRSIAAEVERGRPETSPTDPRFAVRRRKLEQARVELVEGLSHGEVWELWKLGGTGLCVFCLGRGYLVANCCEDPFFGGMRWCKFERKCVQVIQKGGNEILETWDEGTKRRIQDD